MRKPFPSPLCVLHLSAEFDSCYTCYAACLDEASAKEEARRSVSTGSVAYAKADVVVKLGGWDPEYTRAVAQGCLVALKQLTLSDKKLAGMHNIKPLSRHKFDVSTVSG